MKKIIIILVIILIGIIGTMYLIDFNKMKNGEEVIFGTWGKKYSAIVKTNQNNNATEENYQKYSKTVGDTTIELDILNGWNYKEIQAAENDDYIYALKLFKSNEEQCAILYFYKENFGVCGSERTFQNITLNNGKQAVVGYYENSDEWIDISFAEMNHNIAIINRNLQKNDNDEIIKIIKTINIEWEVGSNKKWSWFFYEWINS